MRYFTLLFTTLIFGFVLLDNAQAQVKKKVIFEKFTSSNCGNCPNGIGTIESILDEYGEDCIIWVSHHAGWLWDPMNFADINTIAMDFTNGAPTGMIDRIQFIGNKVATTPSNWEDKIVEQLNESGKVGISFSGNYNDASRTIDLNVTARFEESVPAGDLRLNVFIIEDLVHEGSAYDQSNYFNNTPGHPFQGAGQPIVGYQHRYVTRAVLDDPWGNAAVIPPSPTLNTDYTANYTYELEQNFDESQISIVAFVSYYDDDPAAREIINGDQVNLGDLTTTSIESLVSIESMTVFPNPASDFVKVMLESKVNEEILIEVIDAAGRSVYVLSRDIQPGINPIDLNLDALGTGLYLVRMTSEEGMLTRKLNVMR